MNLVDWNEDIIQKGALFMDVNLSELHSEKNPKVYVKIMKGHFARSHSHVNTYIDISMIKHKCVNAREAAKVLADHYLASVEVDTVVCLDGMEVIGAFLAENLMAPGNISVNRGKDISIIEPEQNQLGQMMFRDNMRQMVEGRKVLLLAGSINTGKTMLQAIDTILYYGGSVAGICSVFSAASSVAGMSIYSIFTTRDIPEYQVSPSHDCPMCRQGMKVDAIVNSYGYSEV